MIKHFSKRFLFRFDQGVTLIELLIVMSLFGIIMASLFSAYTVQLKQSMTEYKLSQSEMEFQIGKNVIQRDLKMTGFGMADDYAGYFDPKVIEATDADPDTLTLRGTALGNRSRASQSWSYVMNQNPVGPGDYKPWTDSRETLRSGDVVVYIEPNKKKIIALDAGDLPNETTDRRWIFPYPPGGTSIPNPLDAGVVAYGLHTANANKNDNAGQPYYDVIYSLSGPGAASGVPSYCEPSSGNLRRWEKNKASDSDNQPLMNCVLDFQVAFGLDDNEDDMIDCWDNGGVYSAGYPADVFRKRLKQIRAYILIQQGRKDLSYLHLGEGADSNEIMVGDWSLTKCGGAGLVGHTFTLNSEQRHYRWKVIRISVAPRNIRE